MRTIRVAAIGTLLGVLMIAIAPSAQAADRVDAAPPMIPAAAEVTDEPWSAPAYPVNCDQTANQVSCVPTSTADAVAQKCFLRVVLSGGDRVTICTTYDGHTGAIQAAGGKEGIVEYGCSLGDVVCLTFENAGRGMAAGTTAMMFAVAEVMRFDTSTALWGAATGEWSFWRWAVLAVMFAAMVWAIAAAVASRDRGELVSAIVRSFLAFPATAATLWLTGHVLNAVDELTWYIMNRDGPAALFGTLQQVMWAGGRANYFFGFVIHGLLMISMLLLMLVFTFRNIALAALIMVGPLAWMLFPVRSIGPQWVVRYISALLVLLLTAPLTIGFVTLIINGLASMDSIWNPQAWPLLIGLVLVAFAPFAVFGLFSFVGAVTADATGSSLGSRAGRTASGAARSVMSVPARIGASPAGVASRTGAASRSGAAAPAGPAGRPDSSRPLAGTAGSRPAPATSTAQRATTPTSAASSSTPSSATTPKPASTPPARPTGAERPIPNPSPRDGRPS